MLGKIFLINKRSFTMKKIAGLMLVMMMVGFLGACTSTCCQEPTPVYKGRG